MIIEWIGGPHDGQRFEVPDSTDYIEVTRSAGQVTWPSEGVELEDVYVSPDVKIIEIVRQRNRPSLVHWKES